MSRTGYAGTGATPDPTTSVNNDESEDFDDEPDADDSIG